MTNSFVLNCGKEIGIGKRCFLVAEIGNNHQGKFELAVKLIEEAAKIGVDAVKFQKRDVRAILTKSLYNAPYPGNNSFGSTYGEHRNRLELSIEDFCKLKELDEKKGLVFFSSVWDEKSLMDVLNLGVEIIKISSADLVNLPLIRTAAKTKKIIFLSTGMSTLDEIDVAVQEITKENENLVLLHCTSSYPCEDHEVCLPVIPLLRERYKVPVGYSGHEIGIVPSIGAVALGACVLERHFTLDKNLPGTDHKLSLVPKEFERLIKDIRRLEKAMSIKEKRVFNKELESAKKLRKSIVASKTIKKGERLTQDNLTVKSPGLGISPIYWDKIIGKRATKDIREDEFIRFEDIV